MDPEQIANLITEDPDEYVGLEDADEFKEEDAWVQELQAIVNQDDPLIVFVSHEKGDKIIFGDESSLRKLYGFVDEIATFDRLSNWLANADTHAYGGNGPEILHIELLEAIL